MNPFIRLTLKGDKPILLNLKNIVSITPSQDGGTDIIHVLSTYNNEHGNEGVTRTQSDYFNVVEPFHKVERLIITSRFGPGEKELPCQCVEISLRAYGETVFKDFVFADAIVRDTASVRGLAALILNPNFRTLEEKRCNMRRSGAILALDLEPKLEELKETPGAEETIAGTILFIENYLTACRENPSASVFVSSEN